jgi:hypothetical protein
MPDKKNSIHFTKLKKVWAKRHRELSEEIFKTHKESLEWLTSNSKQLAVGSLAGLFLLTQPIIAKVPIAFSQNVSQVSQTVDKKAFLVFDLKSVMPESVQSLSTEQENKVSQILTRDFGLPVVPEVLGKRLNSSYGLIGQEQHLARFPGDNMYSHFTDPVDAQKYWDFGMAPGLGAWGYFATSKEKLTQKDIEREKYYIAVQTFLAPGFDQNPKEFIEFFKYKKMLLVNPQNGKAIVVVIGDAGPAPWTGKSLGGSPEVMNYLERVDGSQKGAVLYFFIDDPNDTIPLGPINSL